MDISDLLLYAQKHHASDLHLSGGNAPVLRVHGEIQHYQTDPLTSDEIKEMLFAVMTEEQRSEFERELELDFAISFSDDMRFRVNAFYNVKGPAAVLRAVPSDILSLEDLGAPDILSDIIKLNKGLVLVTGPTGSGKSTTLAAMIDRINSSYAKHILTIEDPVEFVHKSKKSLVNQRELGKHTHSFSKALKSALREDPDVILVGEMRDIETIQLTLTAAETGHLVFATLHTNSAPETIDRIIDVFPASSKEMIRALLATSLQAVVTQNLLKSTRGGRVAAYEIMLGTSAVRNLIREGRVPQLSSAMQIGSKFGMQTMRDCVGNLVGKGLVDEETATAALASVGKEGNKEFIRIPKEATNEEENEIREEKVYKHVTSVNSDGF